MSMPYLTPRDLDLLTAVERCPLTVRSARTLSVTFHRDFSSDRRLQDRLVILTRAGLLRRFRYATTEGMGQFYYTLSPEGFRLLHGKDAPLPSPGLFREVGIARQHHTKILADFIVHTTVAAHREGVALRDFHRENTLKLRVDAAHLYPDTSFTLSPVARAPFLFHAELDNSTEPMASSRERESWLGKIRFYESLQDRLETRFRVLALITKSPQRVRNLLALAGAQAKNPQRSLVLAVYLPEYLQHPSPLVTPIFTDHRGQAVSLLPRLDVAPAQSEMFPHALAQPVAV
jgi:hypothetical protein